MISKRRALKWLIFGAGAALLAVFLLPKLDGRLTAPVDERGEMTRGVILSADLLSAAEYAPVPRRTVLNALETAIHETNAQRARTWLSRDYRPAWRLMSSAQQQALDLYRLVQDRRAGDAEAVRLLLQQVEWELQRVLTLSHHTAQTAVVRQRVAQAEIKFRDARNLAGRGSYRASLKAGQESITAIRLAQEKSLAILSRFNDPIHLTHWQDWIQEAIAKSRRGATALVVIKEQHRLDCYEHGRLTRSLSVDLGANSIYQKNHEGDRCTPEGRYVITRKIGYGRSKYGQALLIDYPNNEDRQRFQQARSRGEIPPRAGIGGSIEIHGQGGRGYDWTDGCVAPNDSEMKWLYNRVSVGTPVVIVGSDGTDGPIRTTLKENGSNHEPRNPRS